MLNVLMLSKNHVRLSLACSFGVSHGQDFERWTKDGKGCLSSSEVPLRYYWMWIVLYV